MFLSPTSKVLLNCVMVLLIAAATCYGSSAGTSAPAAVAEACFASPLQPTTTAQPADEENQPDPARDHDAIVDPDPVPPEAQALAESVLNEAFNEDKITHLRMNITTLVDHTTGVEGFTSVMQPEQTTLQQRLDALGAKETSTKIIIRLPGSILFDFNSAAIRPDAERALGKVLEVVNAYAGRPVRVEGHTDSIASEAYNQKLSERRAASVSDWFAAHGVEVNRLKTVGWGESSPVSDNSTPTGRQQNRRVEVIIEKAS